MMMVLHERKTFISNNSPLLIKNKVTISSFLPTIPNDPNAYRVVLVAELNREIYYSLYNKLPTNCAHILSISYPIIVIICKCAK